MFWSKSVTLLCLSGGGARAFVRNGMSTGTPLQHRSFRSTSSAMASLQYLLTYDYVPDVLEKRGPYREEHLKIANDMVALGRCAYGGPKGPVEEGAPPTGALFIFSDLETAQSFVEKDPYVSAGIVTGHKIEAWTVGVSKGGL